MNKIESSGLHMIHLKYKDFNIQFFSDVIAKVNQNHQSQNIPQIQASFLDLYQRFITGSGGLSQNDILSLIEIISSNSFLSAYNEQKKQFISTGVNPHAFDNNYNPWINVTLLKIRLHRELYRQRAISNE